MSLDLTLNVFRAIGEETRLRIVALLLRGELTVSELTSILAQSQPRVSRHLKILADAGVVERHREGSWIFYRFGFGAATSLGRLVSSAIEELNASNDRVIARDGDRFDQARAARAAAAAEYFRNNASDWDKVRGLHIEEGAIEARMRDMLGDARVETFVDFGTGTGRMLSLFADRFHEGLGFDMSREMLSVARANLERDGVSNAQVRYGDIFSLPVESGAADAVCVHHVLHFLAEPGAAVKEAARLLKRDGLLIISDFAPHDLEFLREEHAHRRLGFSDEEVAGWCAASGVKLVDSAALPPKKDAAQGLTVKIWLGKANGTVRQMSKNRRAA